MTAHSSRPTGEVNRRRLCGGLILLLIYALPAFFPPESAPPRDHPTHVGLWERMFPEVPGWWVSFRLLALFAGAWLISGSVRPRIALPRLPAAGCAGQRSSPERRWQIAALAAAVMHVVGIAWMSTLPALGQALFVLWPLLPALLLSIGERSAVSPSARMESMRLPALTLAVIAVWLAVRLPLGWDSPRAADIVDMWRMWGGLERLSRSGNFLIESPDPELPGGGAELLFWQGLTFFRLTGSEPSLHFLQVVHASWLAVAALALAAVARMVVAPATAPIAAAVFLFSPYVALAQIGPTPLFAGPLHMGLTLFLALHFRRSGSAAVLVLLAGVAGIAAGNPRLLLAVMLVLAATVTPSWRPVRLPAAVWGTAMLTFCSALAPFVPNAETLVAMQEQYSSPSFPWQTAERAIQGQISPTLWDWLGTRHPGLAVPLAVPLAPFAVARGGMRLWGDVILDPIGASLLAVGVLLALRRPRVGATGFLLLLFAATLVPGCISNLDRPSLLRIAGAPIPMALLASVGFAGLLQMLPARPSWRTAAVVGVLLTVAASGTVIFDVVNPRILPSSSVGLAIRASGDDGRVALLTAEHLRPELQDSRRLAPMRIHDEADWLRSHHPYFDAIVREVPRWKMEIVPVERLEREGQPPSPWQAFLWRPAIEQTAGIAGRLCRLLGGGLIFTIRDQSSLARIFALRPPGSDWSPSLPAEQWSTRECFF